MKAGAQHKPAQGRAFVREFLLIILASLCGIVGARGTGLVPGGVVGPPVPQEFNPVGATPLFTLNSPFSSGVLVGNLISTVLGNDLSNPYGGLTFTYQIQLSSLSTHAVSQLSVSAFASFLTDVSFTNSPVGIAPSFISRSSEGGGIGDVMRFHFGDFGPPLNPGTNSALLVVQTDTAFWQTTTASLIDGVAAANVPSLAPQTIPEPAAVVVGLVALGLLYYRNLGRSSR